MSEIINKPQPPVVRSGCKAPPPFRRIPGGAGKPGTKKGDSRKNLPHSHARQNYLLQHAPSAFSAQHDLVESHFSAQQDLDESHASALRVAASASRSFGRSSGSPALSSLLVRITAAAYHCNGSHYDNKGKDLFHSVKGLIISYSVTSQRYIFVRILQIKISDIFKACVCCWQAGA